MTLRAFFSEHREHLKTGRAGLEQLANGFTLMCDPCKLAWTTDRSRVTWHTDGDVVDQ